ncbi:MAG: glycoside hydrolase family 99-like domain-containing protein [Candidatus Cohnella colombiensis]|uniref:Glycoside hydrolase family 99-like domain-containing protein n=1 Tax=Candidatus Cohnella colombiensis TaxID=3121368 RepID=A0AA95EVJ4_9BACL|nr:MAG: glycoside hydrolase family 99-like domain-containing protein [Cohnella sp.]
MNKLKLTTKAAVRRIYHSLPLNSSQKLKLKNGLYTSFGFMIRNTEMYRGWKSTQGHLNGNLVSDLNDNMNDKKQINDQYMKYIHDGFTKGSLRSEEYIELSNDRFELNEDDINLIAFYLPQFHPIPENDEWWGKGFTEWTNVTKAVPQYLGHHQPQLPVDIGFYDLRMIDVIERQVELAKQYGVYGFCFHHYWFGGKRLLEKPVDNFLNHKEIDFPFCVCWANENWTRRWDGQENDILMAQNHSPEDDIAFITDLERYLSDKRYIRVDGKPLIIVYRPQILPDPQATTDRWREYCRNSGVGEIHLVGAKTFGMQDPTQIGFDAAVEFPPHVMHSSIITNNVGIINPQYHGIVYDYEEHVRSGIYLEKDPCITYKTVAPGWDNTARKPNGGHIFHGSNPRLYKEWLQRVIKHTNDNNNQFVFINAWNEWAEGAHLEPDRKYGYGYLQATKEAIIDSRNEYRNVEESFENSQYNNTISIIAPAYNHDKYIENCIRSLANQSYEDKELIIIDDCSSDNTVREIKKLINDEQIASKFTKGITFIQHLSNKGAHHSINEGLKIASGKYLTIINTDDLYEENRLEMIIGGLETSGSHLAFSKVKTIDDEGKVAISDDATYFQGLQEGIAQESTILFKLLNNNVAISTGNLLFTKELYAKIGGFKGYKYVHDWDFILKATLITEPTFVESTNYLYRLHASNSYKELQQDVSQTNEEVNQVLLNVFKQLNERKYMNKRIPELTQLNKLILHPLFQDLQKERDV